MISCQCTVDIHARITHRQTNCLRQVRFRILIFSALQEQHTPRRPCIRIIAVHLDGLIRIVHSLQRILLFQRHLRTHQVRIRITRRDTNQRIQIRTCLRVFLLVHPAQSQVMPQTDILRIHLQGLAIILDSPLIILLADTRNTANLIRIHHKRIAFQRLRTVGLRPLIIIQVHLSQSTVKIRFSQIRFRPDYLIEILDREDIILKIKCIFPDGHNPVRINLRQGNHREKHTYI